VLRCPLIAGGLLVLAIGLLWLIWARVRVGAAARVQALQMQLDEQQRHARDSHDGLLQGVQGLALSLQALLDGMAAADPSRAGMELALLRVDHFLLEGRERTARLFGCGDQHHGLAEALHDTGTALAREHGIAFRTEIGGRPRPLLAPCQEELYLIFSAALPLFFQAPGTLSVRLRLDYQRWRVRMRLSAEGADVEASTLQSGAWRGMHERAQCLGARLRWRELPGGGSELELGLRSSLAYRPR
jgi:signal transduction histidine kinase